jgi:hypothetical protein
VGKQIIRAFVGKQIIRALVAKTNHSCISGKKHLFIGGVFFLLNEISIINKNVIPCL